MSEIIHSHARPCAAAAAAVALLLVAGCPEDGDDDTDGDDDASDDDDADGVPDVVDGTLTLFSNTGPDYVGGVEATSTFYATFIDTTGPLPAAPEEIEVPGEIDTCTLSTYAWSAPDYTGVLFQGAGTITLERDGVVAEFEPQLSADQPTVYYSQVLPSGLLLWDTTYGLSATGGEVPAFSLPDAFLTTADLVLEEPPVEETLVLGDEDLVVRWSGGGHESVWLTVSSGDTDDLASILCEVEDDGEFVVPGSLMEQLPAGSAGCSVSASVSAYHQVGQRWLLCTASVASMAVGYRP